MKAKTLHTLEEYNEFFKNIQEHLNMAKYRVENLKTDGIKKRGVEARALLMNIKKICHIMRAKISSDLANMPKKKRYDTEESLARAREKRRKTLAEKKKKGIKNGK